MKYYTTKTTHISKTQSNCFIGFGTLQLHVSPDALKDYIDVLFFCLSGKTELEINNYIQDNPKKQDAFNSTIKHRFIVKKTNYSYITDDIGYKNRLYSDIVVNNSDVLYNNISKTTLLIIGSGGIGNFIAYSLCSFPFKKIILLDGDKIEKSNLNRQFLFTNEDIGEYKVDVLKRELLRRNDNLYIETIREFADKSIFCDLSKIKKSLAIVSADGKNIMQYVAKNFVPSGTPFISVGYLNDISRIGPFWCGEVECSCPFCGNEISLISDLPENMKQQEINNNYSAPSSFVNNAFASAMATSDVLSYLAEDYDKVTSLSNAIGIGNTLFNNYKISIKKDPNCLFCGNANAK